MFNLNEENKSLLEKVPSVKKLVGAGTVLKHKIIDYGFKESLEEKGVYHFSRTFANGDFSLCIDVVNGEVISDKVIDMVTLEECNLNLIEGHNYWDSVRNEYSDIIADFVESCIKPEKMTYLLPEQREALENEQVHLAGRLKSLSDTIKSIVDSRDSKYCGGNEGGGIHIVDRGDKELMEIETVKNSIESIQEMLDNSMLPEPVGEEVMIGSRVDYSSIDNKESGKIYSVLITEGPYVRNDEEIRFCTDSSSLGLGLMGHETLDTITLPNGKIVTIVNVDNDYIYNRYFDEYQEEGKHSFEDSNSHGQKTMH